MRSGRRRSVGVDRVRYRGGGHVIDELQDRARSVVIEARTRELPNPQVTAGTIREARTDLVEQLLEKRSVVVEMRRCQANVVERLLPRERDDLLAARPILLRLRHGRNDSTVLDGFLASIDAMKERGLWNKLELVDLFNKMIPDFNHKETGKYLDGRM